MKTIIQKENFKLYRVLKEDRKKFQPTDDALSEFHCTALKWVGDAFRDAHMPHVWMGRHGQCYGWYVDESHSVTEYVYQAHNGVCVYKDRYDDLYIVQCK